MAIQPLSSVRVTGASPEPTILEMGPNEVMVAYKWVKDGESNAEGSGRSVSVFTLDPDTGDVTREGDLPPY